MVQCRRNHSSNHNTAHTKYNNHKSNNLCISNHKLKTQKKNISRSRSKNNLIHNFLYQFSCNFNLLLITSNSDGPFFRFIPLRKMLGYQLNDRKKVRPVRTHCSKKKAHHSVPVHKGKAYNINYLDACP